MPQVFHEQEKIPLRFREQGVQQVDGGFRHLPAGVPIAEGEELLIGAVGHMEDHIFGPLGPGLLDIPAVSVHERFRPVAAVKGTDRLPAAQILLAGRQIPRIKVVPIGKKAEVDAYDPLFGHHAAHVLAAVHELQTVETVEGAQQILPVPISVQVVPIGGEIEGALHGSTLWSSRTSVSASPSGPMPASQRYPWQLSSRQSK